MDGSQAGSDRHPSPARRTRRLIACIADPHILVRLSEEVRNLRDEDGLAREVVLVPLDRLATRLTARGHLAALVPLLTLLASAPAVPVAAQARGATAFVDVTVVRPDRGDVLPARTVVIEDGRITEMGPAASTSVPAGAVRIDGRGAYLVPGLIELNGYLPHPDDVHKFEDVLLGYVARGVTLMRAPRTHRSHESLQRRVEAGGLVGPRVLLLEPAADATVPPTEAAAPARGLLADDSALPFPDGEATPHETLRRLTRDAALALGIEGEVGAVEVGRRADLMLLSADPLESVLALERIAGVMVGGRWLPHAEIAREIESRAKHLIVREYYDFIDRFYVPPALWIRSCEGVSLQDCFGGDPECVLMNQGPGGIRNASVCRDPILISERRKLLDRLDLLGRALPQSDWIAGQRVYLAWKNEELERGEKIAESCRATLWWCQALRGFAKHQRVQGSGQAQLDSALAGAPPGTRAWADPLNPPPERRIAVGTGEGWSLSDRGIHCEWTDLSEVIPGGYAPLSITMGNLVFPGPSVPSSLDAATLLPDYQRLPCGQNRAFEDRYWWLSDPLWSAPGNARWSEHITRQIRRRLAGEILPRKGVYTPELRKSVLALGPPNSWTRGWGCSALRWWEGRCPDGSGVSTAYVIGRPYVSGGYSFTPSARLFYGPLASTPDDWAVTWNSGHERMFMREERYDLEYHQTAVLRRGSGLLALAAARLPVLVPSFDSVRAALAMGRPADLRLEVAHASVDATGVARASVELDDGEWMASVEIVGAGWWSRARKGAPAPVLENGFGVSDPVLVDERFAPDSVALGVAMLPSTDLSRRSEVGVYFEVYGAEEGEPLRIAISAARQRSLLGRITDALRFRAESSLGVSWTEAAELAAPGLLTRQLTVDLSGLDAGDYLLGVQVERADGTVTSSSRAMRVGGR